MNLFDELDGYIRGMDGYNRYGGKLKHPFTAHPKADPTTGELLTFGYKLMEKPYCTYSVIDNKVHDPKFNCVTFVRSFHHCLMLMRKGELVRSVPINIPEPVMMHDFAITEKYTSHLLVSSSITVINYFHQSMSAANVK
jgi:carotenoid cleavage dioxygenase-like enzyme